MHEQSGKIYTHAELTKRGVTPKYRERLVEVRGELVPRVCYLPRPKRREWAALVRGGMDAMEALARVQGARMLEDGVAIVGESPRTEERRAKISVCLELAKSARDPEGLLLRVEAHEGPTGPLRVFEEGDDDAEWTLDEAVARGLDLAFARELLLAEAEGREPRSYEAFLAAKGRP